MTQSSPNVLLVDDNPSQRMALSAVLSDLPITIVEASSGREALRHLLRDEFALILLDVNMPGLDGFETAALVRSRPSSEHTPIILLTAYGDDTHASRGYSLGAVDYIVTPVEREVLRTKVSVFIELYTKAQEIAEQREALRRQAQRLRSLSRASLRMNSAGSVEDILRTMAASAGSIIGAHQAAVHIQLPDAHRTLAATQSSELYGNRAELSHAAVPLELIAKLRPSLRLLRHATGPTAAGSPPEVIAGMPVQGWLGASMTGRDGRTFGLVQLSEPSESEFTAEDEDILVQIAQVGSVAIDNLLSAEAREANRLKDEFLGVLSHELRTPLQAMLTWIDIMQRDSQNPATMVRGIEVIQRTARAQSQLIDDLLDVSRIIRGQLRLDITSADLVRVVESAVESLRPAAATKSIQLAFVTEERGCRIAGDAARLQQVVWNLVSNAVKFTPEGGRVDVVLTVRATEVRLEVRDTGPGISSGFLPHVFERFRQADSTTVRRQGGLGLGLAIVRSLVELHGGTAQVENPPEGGALFSITLPRVEPVNGVAQPSPDGNGATAIVRLDGLKVVLVEDDHNAREALEFALRQLGADVITVDSADAALTILDQQRPDVLLSDIGMPGQDGYALIRQVRAREADGIRLPAAALTAYVRPEDKAAALSAGFDEQVRKPVAPAELARAIQRLLGRADVN